MLRGGRDPRTTPTCKGSRGPEAPLEVGLGRSTGNGRPWDLQQPGGCPSPTQWTVGSLLSGGFDSELLWIPGRAEGRSDSRLRKAELNEVVHIELGDIFPSPHPHQFLFQIQIHAVILSGN